MGVVHPRPPFFGGGRRTSAAFSKPRPCFRGMGILSSQRDDDEDLKRPGETQPLAQFGKRARCERRARGFEVVSGGRGSIRLWPMGQR